MYPKKRKSKLPYASSDISYPALWGILDGEIEQQNSHVYIQPPFSKNRKKVEINGGKRTMLVPRDNRQILLLRRWLIQQQSPVRLTLVRHQMQQSDHEDVIGRAL